MVKTLTGFLGLSCESMKSCRDYRNITQKYKEMVLPVGVSLIFSTISYPSTTFPNTGCSDGEDLSKKSRKLLFAVLMNIWEPPELGAPVFYSPTSH